MKRRKSSGRLRLAMLAAALVSTELTSQAQTPDLKSGLKAYWNFDGKNFNDSVGIFDGTGNGADPISFVAGKTGFGEAIKLNGTDQMVEITGGEPDDFAFEGASTSIAGWFKVEAFDKSWQALVAKGEGNNWRVARNSGNPTVAYAGGLTDTPAVTDVSDGKWHHFVAISDSTGANFGAAMYVDGILDGKIDGSAALSANGLRMIIGDNPGSRGRYWNGEIDDLAIWDRVLTEAEIAMLYSNGAGKPLAALIGAAVDADKDGMPDDWEKQYGLNPTDASDAAKDANGNGISNLNEYRKGLDPLDTTKPAILSAFPNSTFDKVVITFSKTLDESTATNTANYEISPKLAVTGIALKKNVVTLTTEKQIPGATEYTVAVKGVKDLSNFEVSTGAHVLFYSHMLIKTGINTGLKAYWNFDGNLKDTVGIFNGTEMGSSPIPYVDGKTGFGQSIQLDGMDQYVEVSGGNPGDLAFAGGNISIAGWFKVEAFDKDWQALVAQGEGSCWRIARRGSEQGIGYAGGLTDTPTGKDVNDGAWHHFAAVSDATGAAFGTALYIDGIRDTITAGKAALAASTKRMMIGNNPDSTARSWNGEIDDLAIWSRMISDAEISALYASGAGKPLSSLSSISVDIPTPAEGTFGNQTPAPNAKNVLPDTSITIVHSDGKIAWSDANVTMKFNGAAVTPTFSKKGSELTIAYKPTAVFPSASINTIALGVLDPGGNPTTVEWSFTVSPYVTLTKAHQAVSVDKNKPGFLWRIFQNEAVQSTSVVSTEAALAGLLKADDGSPVPNLADPSATGVAMGLGIQLGSLIQFEIPTVINVSQNGTDNAGNWTTDDVMPGIPGTTSGADGIDAEIITFVDFPAGVVTMGVNSDDGFLSQAAYINKSADGLFLGEFNGARGAADTTFMFIIQDAGIYPIRTIWQDGGGGANIEIFTVKADGTKVLLNDKANGGYACYRIGTAPNKPVIFNIAVGSTGGKVTMTWTEAGVILQESLDLKTWTDLSSATSPYQPTVSGAKFYRLKK